jgi:polar amino acid transport system substrate-binding protein
LAQWQEITDPQLLRLRAAKGMAIKVKKYGCVAAILMLALGWMLAGCSKQDAPPMAKLEDLANKRIGIYSGTVYDKFVVDNFPAATPMRYKDQADLILAIKGEKIDAAILNYAAAKIMLKANPEVGILTDQVLSLPIGIGFNKNNPALREQFNAFLRAGKADGSVDTMYKKWFETDLDTVKMPKFASIPNGRTIKVGVAVGDLPSSGLIDGEYVGFDVEMLQTFAQKAGLKLEFVSLEFGALIASLASGKVDMIADCISITPERQKQIDFSDAYMEDKTAAIALKRNIAHLKNSDLTDAGNRSFWGGLTQSFYSNILQEHRYMLILDGLQVTLIISVFSLLFGTLLGAVICFLRMSSRKVFREGAKFYISLMRGIPVLVLLMLTYYVIFAKTNISPVLVAVIAFSVNFAAYVAEMYRSAIESIDKGQTEAGIAGGFTPAQTFFYIVMPQAMIRVLPVYKGELISLVKMTSIVGYVAVQDLTKASDIIRSRTFDAFFPLIMSAVLYFMISWGLLQVLEVFEKRTDPRQRRDKNSIRLTSALNGRRKS